LPAAAGFPRARPGGRTAPPSTVKELPTVRAWVQLQSGPLLAGACASVGATCRVAADLNLLLFLLPGFVTLKVREACGRREDLELSRIVDALLFTLYNYAVYFTLARVLGLSK